MNDIGCKRAYIRSSRAYYAKILPRDRERVWDDVWAKLKELCGGGDQVARDSKCFIYIGW